MAGRRRPATALVAASVSGGALRAGGENWWATGQEGASRALQALSWAPQPVVCRRGRVDGQLRRGDVGLVVTLGGAHGCRNSKGEWCRVRRCAGAQPPFSQNEKVADTFCAPCVLRIRLSLLLSSKPKGRLR